MLIERWFVTRIWKDNMRILVTGNMGYVGPAVVRHLRNKWPDAVIAGYDIGFFAHCLTGVSVFPERYLDIQYMGDVRSMPSELIEGCDTVIQLAAISNDPMGDAFANVTKAINQDASIAIARMAASAGVKSFVFASSCSVYGIAGDQPRSEQDALNPLTAYARSKIGVEAALAELETDMTITCLRFATACGFSDRLRLDLVLNDFVAGALSRGSIDVLSDGSPWRPLIDTTDMARAIEWATIRPASQGGRFLSINSGCDAGNYQVADLARAVASAVPGTSVSINRQAPVDSRSYRVSFDLYRQLAPDHQPQANLKQSIERLVTGLRSMKFEDQNYRTSSMIRLSILARLRAEGQLDEQLRWENPK